MEIQTESIGNTKYKVKKLGNNIFSVISRYAPYADFSNCDESEYTIRLTNKKGVIVRNHYNDLSGRGLPLETINKVFVDKDKLVSIIKQLDILANMEDIDEIDSLIVDSYNEIVKLYNYGDE